MYSLIKGYISRETAEDEQEAGAQLCRPRTRASVRENRNKSQLGDASNVVSGNARYYLSWENVTYISEEIKKTVGKGLQWIALPFLENDMSSKTKRKRPEGTTEYLVDSDDSLAKIALRFDTTPSELTRINKLVSRMLFPGQTLFVPEKNEALCSSLEETSLVQPIINPPQPLSNKDNTSAHENEHEAIKLTKDVSLDEEEEEITENYLKIYAKYITDGQGIVNGVLLVTPHSVMFNPNVSDPLVMDRGRDTYCIATPMSAVTSAAMYKDIAAMAIHDPLKPGRFHLDAATAESLSRQNSIDADSTPPGTPRVGDKPCGNLKEIRESSSCEKEIMSSKIQLGNDTDSVQKTPDCVYLTSTKATDSEENEVIVRDVLNNIIRQITECEDFQNHKQGYENLNDSTANSHLVQETLVRRDLNSLSPVSEDSGIGFVLTHPYEMKTDEGEMMDHSGLIESQETVVTGSSVRRTRRDHSERQSAQSAEGPDSKETDNVDTDTRLDDAPSSSLFSALSNEVKYWLGRGSYGRQERNASESDEDLDIVPRPAAPSNHQPLYLCLRISKKHWCSHHNRETRKLLHGEDLVDRDQRRREHWFAIPPSRTEQVYGFFQRWCPNIHNATDEEESDEEATPATIKKGLEEADEEGIDFVETFYSNSPSVQKQRYPKVSRTHGESKVPRVKRGFGGLKTKPGKATKVMTSPKPSPDFLEDSIPDMVSKSEILRELHLKTLNNRLPSRTVGHCWALVYSTFEHGFSLKTLYRKMECYDSPVLIVVMDGSHHIFGALCSCPLRISEGFFGTGESFLYKFDQDAIKIFRWTGNNNFFMKGSKDSVAIGSGGGNFGLWLDEDLYHGSSHPCQTYDNEQLSSQEDFLCSGLEVWTFV